jgi:PAS domain-containing protein
MQLTLIGNDSDQLLLAIARIICHSSFPQIVLFANKAWTQLTGYEQHEIEGQTLKKLGPTELDLIRQVRIKLVANTESSYLWCLFSRLWTMFLHRVIHIRR